jgi:sulfur-carrier protein
MYSRAMTRVVFTKALERFVPCPPQEVEGATVREALDQAFEVNPRLRGYILDEHGEVRHHVTVFVDGQGIRDRVHLTDPIQPGTEIYVMQALSGG